MSRHQRGRIGLLPFVVLIAASLSPRPGAAEHGGASVMESAGQFCADGRIPLPYRQVVIGEELPGRYDLVLFLHGAGERGDDNLRHLVFGYEPMLRYCLANRVKAVLLFPQCPKGAQWSSIRVPAVDPPLTPEAAPPLASAVQLLCEKTAEFAPGKVYAVGISMGGYGVWDLLIRHRELFSAGVAICGGGDVGLAGTLVDLPLYVAHGSHDILVPVERSRAMVKAIWDAGGNKVVYQEFPLVGHDVWNHVFAEEAVWSWLFRRHDVPLRTPSRFFPVPKVFPWQSRLF